MATEKKRNRTPNQRLDLVNDFDSAFPASAWWPVMTIKGGKGPGAGAEFGLDRELRWTADIFSDKVGSYTSPYVRFALAGSSTPISRSLDPIGDSIEFTEATQKLDDIGATSQKKDYTKLLDGFRYLTDAMIEDLAERIVDEVRLRGPFYSVADFVNRRLAPPAGSGDAGSPWGEARTETSSGSGQNDNDFIATDYDPFIGLLAMIGPALAARGDTFLVRAYGDEVDGHGRVVATARIEAVVQRVIEPVEAANPSDPTEQFRPVSPEGRKLRIIGLRWLDDGEY